MASSAAAPRPEVELVAPDEALGGTVALRYVARAGLLPELSRQTYDSFPKALREAVLNALDAEATRVDIDFSRVESDRAARTSIDDGVGMSMRDFCEQFMSLGGSSKFGDGSRFGRIGIGSLALLQYAEAATIETKRAGSRSGTRARIQHPWILGRERAARPLERDGRRLRRGVRIRRVQPTTTSRESRLRTSTPTSGRSAKTQPPSTRCSKDCDGSFRCPGARAASATL